MNSLERTLIEKAGYSHGWENVRQSTSDLVVIYSARHKAEAHLTPTAIANVWQVAFPKGPPIAELIRSLPELHKGGGKFRATDEASLGRLLRRASELAMSLPNQAAEQYGTEIATLEANPPSATEALALVKQRRGQNLFRTALMEYWGGACAISGISIPELLRASHSKPWVDCDNDKDRLNVYNGFLLSAHLDALFDQGLMTFSAEGKALFSSELNLPTLEQIGVHPQMQLRWKALEHEHFLQWHRKHLFRV